MTLAEAIYQKSLALPPEKTREVLDFIDCITDHSVSANVDAGAIAVESRRRTPCRVIAGKGKTLGDLVALIIDDGDPDCRK